MTIELVNTPQGMGPSVVTDWEAYTPTISGGGTATFTTNTAKYRRVGTCMEITGQLIVNAAGNGTSTVTISIPAGLTLELAKLATNNDCIGHAAGYSIGGTAVEDVHPLIPGSTTSIAGYKRGGTVVIRGSDLAAGAYFRYMCRIPILEWADIYTAAASGTIYTNTIRGHSTAGVAIVGRTDGVAPAAGMVGETFKQTNGAVIIILSGVDTTVFTQVLTPGRWLITGHAIGGCNGNNTLHEVWNYLKINGSIVNTSGVSLPMLAAGINPRMSPASLVWVNDSAASITVTLTVLVVSPGACYTAASLICIRI